MLVVGMFSAPFSYSILQKFGLRLEHCLSFLSFPLKQLICIFFRHTVVWAGAAVLALGSYTH